MKATAVVLSLPEEKDEWFVRIQIEEATCSMINW